MFANDAEAAGALATAYKALQQEIGQVIYGQDDVVKTVLVSVFSNGHCLLVGVPGLAKTLLVQTVAQALRMSFTRVQFTPDLMPSDITGAEILDEQRQFRFVQGPVFANLVLADEINRTPPKTQAALLEAMQERHVTVGGREYALPNPFFVLATQNPIEQEGTYPLPEAQLDRFMFNVKLDYPAYEDELQVVRRTTSGTKSEAKPVLSAEEIVAFQQLVRRVPMPDNVLEYIVSLVASTRPGRERAHELATQYFGWGAGPRASQYLAIGAKCHALLQNKFSPDIEDVRAVALPILRHRVVLSYKAEAEGLSVDELLTRMM